MRDVQPVGGAEASRRALLAGACGLGAVTALGGCATYGGSSENQAAPTTGSAAPAGPATSPVGTSAPPAGGEPALAEVADIPLGGGRIFADRKVVVTQPQQGTIKAFSTTCTHAGCTVSAVTGGTINCPCHGSRFRIADGSVAGGPAGRPLPPVAVTVQGNAIRLA
jgi:Rieske Fe-S protein